MRVVEQLRQMVPPHGNWVSGTEPEHHWPIVRLICGLLRGSAPLQCTAARARDMDVAHVANPNPNPLCPLASLASTEPVLRSVRKTGGCGGSLKTEEGRRGNGSEA